MFSGLSVWKRNLKISTHPHGIFFPYKHSKSKHESHLQWKNYLEFKMAKFHFHFSFHLCLTWISCCERNTILSVEGGFILGEEAKVKVDKLAGERVRHGRLSP